MMSVNMFLRSYDLHDLNQFPLILKSFSMYLLICIKDSRAVFAATLCDWKYALDNGFDSSQIWNIFVPA